MKRKKNVYKTEEQDEIKRFFIILVVVLVIILGVYFFTKYVVNGVNVNKADEVEAGSIDYSIVNVGTMLGKSDEKYYVLAYDFSGDDAFLNSTISSLYENKAKLPIYELDLGNKLNENYLAGDKESNPKAKKIEDLAFKGVTLIKVEDGKITKYIEGTDAIKTELGL